MVQCEGMLNRPAQLPDMVWPRSCSSCPNLRSQAASEPRGVCRTALRCLWDARASVKSSCHPTPAPHGDAVPTLLRIRLIHSAAVVPCRCVGWDRLGASKQPHSDRSPSEDEYWTRAAPLGAPQGCAGLCSAAQKHHVCPEAEGAVPRAPPSPARQQKNHPWPCWEHRTSPWHGTDPNPKPLHLLTLKNLALRASILVQPLIKPLRSLKFKSDQSASLRKAYTQSQALKDVVKAFARLIGTCMRLLIRKSLLFSHALSFPSSSLGCISQGCQKAGRKCQYLKFVLNV